MRTRSEVAPLLASRTLGIGQLEWTWSVPCRTAGGSAPGPAKLVPGFLLKVQKEKAVSLLCRQQGMRHRKMLLAKGADKFGKYPEGSA